MQTEIHSESARISALIARAKSFLSREPCDVERALYWLEEAKEAFSAGENAYARRCMHLAADWMAMLED